jgi:hypothetical protein
MADILAGYGRIGVNDQLVTRHGVIAGREPFSSKVPGEAVIAIEVRGAIGLFVTEYRS